MAGGKRLERNERKKREILPILWSKITAISVISAPAFLLFSLQLAARFFQ
jgi:hypothetical protein